MDNISLEILKILQKKARIPNVEVSRQVGLAPSAVLERIRKLEKKGIIDGYEVRLNPDRFNRSQLAFISVVTEPAKTKEVGEKLARLSAIQEVHFIASLDGFLVKTRVANTEELARLLQEDIATIGGVVSTSTETVLSTIKESGRIPIPDTL